MKTIQPDPNPDAASQEQFLRLFLASEAEVFRYTAALVPKLSDAQEIVQQTALALWAKFDEYDPAQPFTPWACRFALNQARQWLAHRARWQSLLSGDLAETLARRREELATEIDARFAHLASCLEQLPPANQALVEGYYYRRATVEALATESGRTVEAIYKSLQRIRQALLKCIQGALAEEAHR